MEFLKINRFAWILAIACACLFPAYADASIVYYNPTWPESITNWKSRMYNESYKAIYIYNWGYTVSDLARSQDFQTQKYTWGQYIFALNWIDLPNWFVNYSNANYMEISTLIQWVTQISNWKIVLWGWYFWCVYQVNDWLDLNQNTWRFWEFTQNEFYICPQTIQWYEFVNFNNSSPSPTPPPAEVAINWLNCTTDFIPDIENATWYNNFMNNTWFLYNVDDDWWIRFFSWSGSIYDFPEAQYVNRAWLYYADQTAWWNFASGSLNYPWTARTTIRWWNKSPLLLSFSDSEVKPNVVQWHGVNSVALWYAWTVQFQNTQLQDSSEVPISASGGIATAVISGNERINKVLLNYSSWFNWFRYWVAPTTSKSSCSYKYNLCEWSIEWANTVCQSWNLVWWIPAWNCVITGSWSVYGSWACVPETTASGAIIPPVMVPWVTVYDSEWNPVWNIYENESVTPDLSCDYSTTDWWTDKIWKTFQCVTSFFSSSAKLSKDWISWITWASQQLWESIKQDIWTNTWTTATWSSNPLLNSLYWVDEWVKEYKYVKLSYALLIFTVTVFLIVMLSIILKSWISNIKN